MWFATTCCPSAPLIKTAQRWRQDRLRTKPRAQLPTPSTPSLDQLQEVPTCEPHLHLSRLVSTYSTRYSCQQSSRTAGPVAPDMSPENSRTLASLLLPPPEYLPTQSCALRPPPHHWQILSHNLTLSIPAGPSALDVLWIPLSRANLSFPS